MDIYFDLFLIVLVILCINYKIGLSIALLYLLMVILEKYSERYKKYNHINTECRMPSGSNPFANYLNGMSKKNIELSVCKNDEKKQIFNELNLYDNAKNKMIGQHNIASRRFITMPNTSYPSNATNFANNLFSK